MQKFKKTDDEMRFNLKNLNRLDWYDADNIRQLEKWGFEIIKVNYRAEKYALDFTKLIHENIDKCSHLFPDWVNWDYIKDLFIIPSYTKKGVLVAEFKKYMDKIDYYPFQMYIHWTPTDCGSIIYSDGKFLNTIYKMNNDIFTDTSKFKDAHEETKNNMPIAVLITFAIYKVTGSAFETSFYIPWSSIIIAVGSVFAVVFATMFYATGKIKNDNPIDALKNENI